jgi:vacuolar-type H+-ATPase subunit E/Vma4
MPLYDQVELLCQAILSQGREEADRIRSRAREQAEALVAAAEARSREVKERTEGQVRAQAEFAARSREDRRALAGKREIAETKEALLGEIFAQGLERLRASRQTPEYQDWLRQRLAKAVQELQGDSFRIVAHPEETRWLTPELLAAVGRETGSRLELATDADTPPGGCIAVRADGQMRYDLTFQGMIDRQRERLRTELARRLWGGEGG